MCIPFFTYSQELKYTGNAGIAVGKNATLKKLMYYKSHTIGYERWFAYEFQFCFAFGFATIQYDNVSKDHLQLFHTIHYITLPVSIKKDHRLSKNSSYNLELGFCNNLKLLHKFKYENDSVLFIKNNEYSMSYLLQGSFKSKLYKNLLIAMGIGIEDDIFHIYKVRTEKLKLKRRFISLSFYRKL